MELRFDLTPGSSDVAKNGTFANAFAFDAGYWTSVTFGTGTGYPGAQPATNEVEMIYLSDTYSFEDVVSGLAADAQYRRGITPRYAVDQAQAGIGFSGIWARQVDILETGAQYDLTMRVQKYEDRSSDFGLPAGSGVIQLKCGRTGGQISVNSTGTHTANATQGGDLHVYVNFYACRGLVDLVMVERSAGATSTVEDPINFDELEEVLESQEEFGPGIVRRFIQEVTFWGEGYNIIQTQLDDYGEDTNVLCDIYRRCDSNDAWVLYFEGIIFFRDYSRDEQKCTIEVTIEENNAYGKLWRNRNAPFTHYETYAINGGRIGSNQVQQVTLDDGSVTYANRNAWYCHDLLELAVKFASDNELAFDAPDLGGSAQGYGANGDFSTMFFTTGYEIRAATAMPAYTTFLDCWNACRKMFGLYFQIEDVAGTLTFIVKKLEDRYDSANTSITLDYVPNIQRDSYTDIRYKTIDIGFQTIPDDWTVSEPLGSIQVRFSSENNRGGSLDLTTNYIGSNNIILTKIAEGSTASDFNEYDSDTFFLQMTTHTSLQTEVITASPPYNQGVGYGPDNNQLVYPWNAYDRHRKNIYESGSLGEVRGEINNGLPVIGTLLDFKGFESWIKIDPGTTSDFYFKWLYNFIFPLDESELAALRSNTEYEIKFSQTNSGHTRAFFKTIRHNLRTGITEIEAFSE